MRMDLETWLVFLKHQSIFCRPFMDFSKYWYVTETNWYTDASGKIGFGAICNGRFWMHARWSENFLRICKPSIEYQELFAVVASVLAWGHLFRNSRLVLFCDNQSVLGMINHTTSSCRNCMVLIRILVLKCMVENLRIFSKYVDT